jgi:ComF family protein
MEALARIGRQTVRSIVDFALPPRCPGCGAVTDEDHRFCLVCWQSIHFLGEPCCDRCGLPFAFDVPGRTECGACIADPPSFDRLRAAVAYGDVPRKVALKLKYSGRTGVARTLARFMERHLADADTLLVPVPLHRWRIWSRGYNQSALVASALAKRKRLPVDLHLLERIRHTPPMRGMGRRERALAVRGAFRVAASRCAEAKGRAITLVDDVYTTGATAAACAHALKRAGAARVTIICWARVVMPEQT